MALIQKAFSDIITFSRSSNATRVGPTGLVEYAPHNLLLQSQTFDNASWTRANTIVTANAVAAPDGTVTADKLIADATTNVHYIVQSIGTSAQYSFSCYMKAAEYTSAVMLAVGANHGAAFNLANGTVSAVYGSATATITSVGNGWYRCVIALSVSGTDFYIYANNAVAYLGDGTSGIYLWGAQLAVGPYALDYTPTTSAAVYGPRFDFDGSGVTIVEPVSTNLLTYSEDFGNAAWNKNNATVSTNTTISPDGQTTADTLTEDTSVGEHFTNQQTSKTATNIQYTFSAYVKRATSGTRNVVVAMTDGTTGGYEAVFDPDDGAILIASRGIGVTTGWIPGAATATNAGNGWWRFTFSVVSNQSTRIDGVVYMADGTTKTYTGNGSSNLFVWGAQLEVGSTATAYMVSSASNGFRAVPVVSGSATPKGLLVEEQRQNLLQYSEQFDNAYWTKGASISVSANASTAPDGVITADAVTFTGTGLTTQVYRTVTVTSGAAYTISLYIKYVSGANGDLLFSMGSDTTRGARITVTSTSLVISEVGANVTSSGYQQIGTGWFRVYLTITSTSTSFEYNLYRPVAYGGAGANVFLLWGAQLEAGSFATSYIPTLASAVTRSADVASVNTLSPWYSSECTIYCEASVLPGNVNNNTKLLFGGGPTGNSPSVLEYTGVLRTLIQNTGFPVDASTGLTATTKKIAGRFKNGDPGIAVNGSVTSDTDTTTPGVGSAFYIGSSSPGTSDFLNGYIRKIAFYPRALTNAELAALTA